MQNKSLLLGQVLCLAALGGVTAAQAAPTAYVPSGQCAGYARLAITAPKGWCVGLVADARDGLRMPRRLLEVAPGRFWITDMGNWEPRRGRLLELRTSGQPGTAGRVTVLAEGLDRPHGLAKGPDGRIYIGEAGSLWRTPVGAKVERDNLLMGLPDQGAHPLKEIVFGPEGQLYVNMGSATDACRNPQGQQPMSCPELEGDKPRAAVYEARLSATGALQSFKPFAVGLRNSLGLVALPGGRVWQAENSVDYNDPKAPAEELNLLQSGSHHGWPYCVTDAKGRSVVAKGYEGRARCDAAPYKAPAMAWPAHVAPLQLLAPPASPNSPWAGKLLAVWHGYRAEGHRIVAWRLDAKGHPQGAREDLLSDWDEHPGLRPRGTPAGATVDSQGRLWVVEDRNRTVLVVAPEN
ncbi:PQQ-dependent sugar dehydrogenase [Ideonella sp.]|uniref:PQQ-dependent sugar dehydrogenase n=1 Tax=Ideonella sp. TaxID=1929293 RepID=UPI0037C15489